MNDWGSAAPLGVPETYEGTFGFDDLPDQAIHTPYVEADLIALVKSTYLRLFNEKPPYVSADVSAFWVEKFSSVLARSYRGIFCGKLRFSSQSNFQTPKLSEFKAKLTIILLLASLVLPFFIIMVYIYVTPI